MCDISPQLHHTKNDSWFVYTWCDWIFMFVMKNYALWYKFIYVDKRIIDCYFNRSNRNQDVTSIEVTGEKKSQVTSFEVTWAWQAQVTSFQTLAGFLLRIQSSLTSSFDWSQEVLTCHCCFPRPRQTERQSAVERGPATVLDCFWLPA